MFKILEKLARKMLSLSIFEKKKDLASKRKYFPFQIWQLLSYTSLYKD